MSDSLSEVLAKSEVVTKKGARTNQLILDAAVDVIFDVGLPNFTFRAVADRVGLSRGALLHHFKDKEALLTSLVGHIYRKRLAELVAGIQAFTEKERKQEQSGVELMFQLAQRPYSVVLREIQAHARTEKYLMKTLKREAAAMLKQNAEVRSELYPEWQFEGSSVIGAYMLIRSVTEGFAAMSIHSELEMDEEELIDLMKFVLRKISKRPSRS